MASDESEPATMASAELSDETRWLTREGRPLGAQLPIRGREGWTLESMEMLCNRCRATIPDADTRVVITESAAGVVDLRGRGYCRRCEFHTPFRYRFTPSGEMHFPDPRTGEWVAQKAFSRPRRRRPWWDLWGRLIAWRVPGKSRD